MKDYIPYVYLIKHKTSGLKYLGVRYAKGCNPSDLWKTYFTSSKLVKKLIDQFGKDDFFIKVIHQFPNDPESAVLKEAYYFPFIEQRDDYLNLTYSSGCQDLRISSRAGKVGGAIVHERKIGIFRNDEERKKWCVLGGNASYKNGNNKQFMFWASDEGRKKRSSMGGKNGNFTLECVSRRYNCSLEEAEIIRKKEQSERGARGGIKNKGFKWYNDGIKSYKYTAQQQPLLSFDDFISQNESFKKGRKL